jgi:PDZ domain-containing protein
VIYGDETREESQRENLQMMDNSKLVASAVALRQLGYPVKVTGTGVQIASIAEDVPAKAVLHPGDVVVRAAGKRTLIDRDLIAAIDGKHPGDKVALTIEPGGKASKRRDVTVTLAPRPQQPTEPMLGVTIQTRGLNYKLPFPIRVATGDVGGPSAGLAFTLAILDRLTPGSLTGGAKVAVTGEISPDGRVLEVGGVGQKAVAARHEGARLMIVPKAEVAEARKRAGSLKVVGVSTLRDALRALDRLGGNALALGRPGAKDAGT